MHQPCCREESLKGLSTDALTLSTAKKKKKKNVQRAYRLYRKEI